MYRQTIVDTFYLDCTRYTMTVRVKLNCALRTFKLANSFFFLQIYCLFERVNFLCSLRRIAPYGAMPLAYFDLFRPERIGRLIYVDCFISSYWLPLLCDEINRLTSHGSFKLKHYIHDVYFAKCIWTNHQIARSHSRVDDQRQEKVGKSAPAPRHKASV